MLHNNDDSHFIKEMNVVYSICQFNLGFMVTGIENIVLHDRNTAAQALGERLLAYQNSNAVLVAIPCGGVPIGFHLASFLHLPLEVVPCRKIKHPAHHHKTIGSVSLDEVDVHEECRDLPQDYVSHQVAMLRYSMDASNKFIHRDVKALSLKGKPVIVVDDILLSGDTMLSCLRSIKKQKPEHLIVAVPFATPYALEKIAPLVDQLIFLQKETERADTYYHQWKQVTEEEVHHLFQEAATKHKKQ